jgi:uncharacterized protein (TIGR02594 family)
MNTTVQVLQRRLIALGYDVGKAGADGILGRATTAAIAKFQADRKLDIQYPGTIGPKTLAALDLDQEQPLLTPPWITLAKTKMGLHEVRNNAELKAFLKSDGHALGDPAKLPWCGDFVETCIAVSLPKELMISNPYWALNWLKFGREVPIAKPVMGAIGVKTRDGGGHVFFVVGHDKTYVHALGGNQSNSISIVKIAKKDVKGLRFPTTYPMPQPLPFSTFTGKLAGSEA